MDVDTITVQDEPSKADVPVKAEPGKPVFKRRPFRPNVPLLPPAALKRQGRIAITAFTTLDDREEAIAFLNTHDEELGGRPLALATESDEGLARVEAVIAGRPADERRALLAVAVAA